MPCLSLSKISVACLDGLAAPGDLLLYRDRHSLTDELIARGGRSTYAHAGMLAKRGERWIVLEMIQWHGGRWRYLDDAVRDDEGEWDLYAANAGNRWCWDRRTAVSRMWNFVGRPYGWLHVIWVALLHLPLIRSLVPVITSDDDADRHSPFCSEAVAIATRLGGQDPVPLLPARLTEPGDLARSLFYDYTCTLAKD
jgi:hypothetical protein